MTSEERDRLFGRVFATPEGRELLADTQARGCQVIPLDEIERRLARVRESWRIGAPARL